MENKLTYWPDDPPGSTRTMKLLAEAAVAFFDVPLDGRDGLKSRTRTNKLVWPRSVCMWIARDAGFSSTIVGEWWSKDHTTVIAATQLVDDLRAQKPAYDKQFRQFAHFAKNYIKKAAT